MISTPIYAIVFEYDRGSEGMYGLKNILAIYETTMDQVNKIWQRDVAPLTRERNIQMEYFRREPQPLFKEWFKYKIEGETK